MGKLIIVEHKDCKDYYDCDLLVVRGASGSGKTRFAKSMQEKGKEKSRSYVLLEADDFFYDEEGNYNWRRSQLPEAHAQCFNNAIKHLQAGDRVIVANTSTKLHEFKQYWDSAKAMKKTVAVIRMYGFHFNDHNVPLNDVIRQVQGYEVFSGTFPQENPASPEMLAALVNGNKQQ